MLKEVVKEFNTTVKTQINGYLTHKSMLVSNDKKCDQKANENADKLMKAAFDKTVLCLEEFRHRIRTEVKAHYTEIGDVIPFQFQ